MNHARPFGLAVILTVLIFSSSIHPARAASCPGLAAPAAIGTALTDVLYDPVAGVMKACVGGSWVSLGTGGGGGASALSGLSDVSVAGIADGKSLVYNGTSSKWEPQTVTGGGGPATLAGLTDIDTTGLGDGKSLVYNATAGKWVPMTLTSGGSGTVSGTTGKIAKFTGAAAVGDSIMTESGTGIGIGMTPTSILTLNAPSNNGLRLNNGTVNGVVFNTNDNSMTVGTVSNHPLNLYTNNASRVVVGASGGMSISGGLTVSMGSTDYSGASIVGENFSAGDTATRLRIQDTTGNIAWFLSANNDGKFALHQGGVGDRITVDNNNGYVGIGVAPATTLDVNGSMIRKLFYAHGTASTQSGNSAYSVTGNTLAFTKYRSDTAMHISWYNNVRAVGSSGNPSCAYEIKVDGTSCSPPITAHIYGSVGSNIHRPVLINGFCANLSVGAHTVTVQMTGAAPGHDQGDCYTGWMGQYWSLEAEEIR